MDIPKLVEDGHYYSPIVDPRSLEEREERLWPPLPTPRGIDYREDAQHELFSRLAPLIRDIEAGTPWPQDLLANDQFASYDALLYIGMLRLLRPQRLIEIGAGYSTRIALEVRARYLGGERPAITCVEPYPQRAAMLAGHVRLIEQPVWDVPPALVDELAAGDIFFVDGSHVSKTGSDLHTVYFDLLPRLAPGVYVQIHDIFLPFEYPRDWVMRYGYHWNEQYLLEALLTDSNRYEVALAAQFFGSFHGDEVRRALNLGLDAKAPGGGSFWLRVREGTTPRR